MTILLQDRFSGVAFDTDKWSEGGGTFGAGSWAEAGTVALRSGKCRITVANNMWAVKSIISNLKFNNINLNVDTWGGQEGGSPAPPEYCIVSLYKDTDNSAWLYKKVQGHPSHNFQLGLVARKSGGNNTIAWANISGTTQDVTFRLTRENDVFTGYYDIGGGEQLLGSTSAYAIGGDCEIRLASVGWSDNGKYYDFDNLIAKSLYDPAMLRFMGGGIKRNISGNITLTSGSKRVQVLDPQGAGYYVRLPDAQTMLPGGPCFYIVNVNGSHDLLIKDYDGTTLYTLVAGNDDVVTIVLVDNSSQAGVWFARESTAYMI